MDIATIVGIMLGFLVVCGSIVLGGGWHYLISLALLVWLLLVLRWHQEAPYLAAAALLVLALARSLRRGSAGDVLTWSRAESFLAGMGVQLVELIGILAPVGVIVGALMLTGTVGNFTYDMVAVAGSNVLVGQQGGQLDQPTPADDGIHPSRGQGGQHQTGHDGRTGVGHVSGRSRHRRRPRRRSNRPPGGVRRATGAPGRPG